MNRKFQPYLLLFILLIFLSFCTIEKVHAAKVQIYISASGNDKNPGTKEMPLASVSVAIERLRTLRKNQELTGTTEVIIGGGEYFISEPIVLRPEDSGTEKVPLVIRAAYGEKPVIYGGKRITGFRKITDKLWRTEVPGVAAGKWNFEQLYVNGKLATRAKSPNKGFFSVQDVSETILKRGSGRVAEEATQKLTLGPDGRREIASFSKEDARDAVLTFYHKWDNTRRRLTSFTRDSVSLSMRGPGMRPWNQFDKKTVYLIENCMAALDTCGEWFLDRSGYLYYIPHPGENLNEPEVIAPVTDRFLVFAGGDRKGGQVEHIHLKGLSFKVAGFTTPLWGVGPAQAAHPVEAAIMADYTSHIELKECEVSSVGTNAVWFRKACHDCLIQACYFHDLGAGGVKAGDYLMPQNPGDLTNHILVDNNIIRSGGFVFPSAVGITLFHASDCQLTHNEIADFRYSGISVGWVWGYAHSPSKRNKIEFNHIHHLGWGELSDMGGVYCLGASEGTTVSNNVIHHVYASDYGGWGLYTDEGSTGIVMENNLVYQCKNSGFHQHYGKENMIRNNIFANNLKAQLQATRIEEHLSFTFTKNIVWFQEGTLFFSNWGKVRINSDYNCYWNPQKKDFPFGSLSFGDWQKSGKDRHSVIMDPGFINPLGGDFRMKNKSVVKKTGFKKFDYSRAGVYGSDSWKELARLDPEVAELFDRSINVTINH